MKSSRTSPPGIRTPRAAQRGNTLLTVLVLLLVMTLLALASLRIGNLEERMTANLFDRGLAFQATEAALREGERRAVALAAAPVAGSACASGVCGKSKDVLTDAKIDELFKAHALAATPLTNNTLAVPKANNVRYLVMHRGSAELTFGCSRILGADGRPKDPLCLVEVYSIEARYQADDRASVALRSVVHVPPSSVGP